MLASTVPWHLLAEERYARYHKKLKRKKRAKPRLSNGKKSGISPQTSDITGKHTKSIISNIDKCLKRKHGQIEYYITQVLTGHGNFNEFFYKINKSDSPSSDLCSLEATDTPEHTILFCTLFKKHRQNNFKHKDQFERHLVRRNARRL